MYEQTHAQEQLFKGELQVEPKIASNLTYCWVKGIRLIYFLRPSGFFSKKLEARCFCWRFQSSFQWIKVILQFGICWMRVEANVGLKSEGKIMASLLSVKDKHQVIWDRVRCLLQAQNFLKLWRFIYNWILCMAWKSSFKCKCQSIVLEGLGLPLAVKKRSCKGNVKG